MERIYHVHVVQVCSGGFIRKIHRVLDRQVPYGECLELGISRPDTPFILMVYLGQADGHLPAARSGRRYYHKGLDRFYIVVFPEPVIADDQRYIGRVVRYRVVPVYLHPETHEPLLEYVGIML